MTETGDNSLVYIKHDGYGYLPAQICFVNDDNTQAVVLIDVPDEWEHHTMLNLTDVRPNQDNSNFQNGEEVSIDLEEYPKRKLPLQIPQDAYMKPYVWDIYDDSEESGLPVEFRTEAAVLFLLKQMYLNKKLYLRCGEFVMIAVNPMQDMSTLYEDETLLLYSPSSIKEQKKAIGEQGNMTLEPHIFEMASISYSALFESQQNQSIVAIGMAGSGKTDTLQYVLFNLVNISLGHEAAIMNNNCTTTTNEVPLAMYMLDADPLFEAFGNCVTSSNDNSSRFARMTEMLFDPVTRVLEGVVFTTYLLDSSRIVRTKNPNDERAFHIFYALLASSPEFRQNLWPGAQHLDATCFRYLGTTFVNEVNGQLDEYRFSTIVEKMDTFLIDNVEKRDVWMSLCIILQLGNIVLSEESCDDSIRSIGTSAMDDVDVLGELMGVPGHELTELMTTKAYTVGKHRRVVKLVKGEIMENRDLFAKTLYTIVFDWLVERMNEIICPLEEDRSQDFLCIRLLDYFGCANFESNHFEQMCANYACEKYQQQFHTGYLSKLVKTYRENNFQVPHHLQLYDNHNVVQLFEKGPGLKTLLIHECKQKTGSDSSFVLKVRTIHRRSRVLIQSADSSYNRRCTTAMFGIRHSVENVIYNSHGFLSANRNKLSRQWITIGLRSKNGIIRTGFENIETKVTVGSITENEFVSNFSHDLDSLMKDLEASQVRTVVCIRPNALRLHDQFDQVSVLKQLRSAGIVQKLAMDAEIGSLEALSLVEFWNQFQCLAMFMPPELEVAKERVEFFLRHIFPDPNMFTIGESQVFLSRNALTNLEQQVNEKKTYNAVLIQSMYRTHQMKAMYETNRKAVVTLQAAIRRWFCIMDFVKRKRMYDEDEAMRRVRELNVLTRRKSAVCIQTVWIGRKYRKDFVRMRWAAFAIQNVFRSWKRRKILKMSMDNVWRLAVRNTRLNEIMNKIERESLAKDSKSLLGQCYRLMKDMQNEMRDLHDKNSSMRKKLFYTEQKEVSIIRQGSLQKEKKEAIALETKSLKAQNQYLANIFKQQSREMNRLKISWTESTRTQTTEAKQARLTLESDLRQSHRKIERLHQQLSTVKHETRTKYKDYVQRADEKLARKQSEVESLRNTLAENEARHADEVAELLTSLEGLKHDRDNIQEKKRNFEEEMKDLENELNTIKQESQAKEARLQKDLVTRNKESAATIADLKKSLLRTKNELSKCQTDLQNGSSEDVLFLRSEISKAHGEARKVKLEMDALRELHRRETDELKKAVKTVAAPCKRCEWQQNMVRAKDEQRRKAEARARAALSQRQNGTYPGRSPYDDDSD